MNTTAEYLNRPPLSERERQLLTAARNFCRWAMTNSASDRDGYAAFDAFQSALKAYDDCILEISNEEIRGKES